MNDNNMNQTPNTGNYYQQSGYPQSQQSFSQSDMPYPMSGYAEEKKSKSKTMQIAIISIVAVLIVALATTLIVVLQKKNQQQMMGMQPPPPPMETIISVSENGSMINGQTADIDFFEEDGKAYLKLEDITSTAGYDFVREDNQVKLLSQLELAIIEVGSTNVTLQDQTSKETSSVEILKAPFEKNGDVYIYSRDLSVFLKNTNVSYNSMTGTIEIRISAGGPGGPPPMNGQMPPEGQAQQAISPQQNAPEASTENDMEKKTEKKNDKVGTSKSDENKREEKPAQNAPEGQPPQGGPGGPPPQN